MWHNEEHETVAALVIVQYGQDYTHCDVLTTPRLPSVKRIRHTR